MVQLRKDRWNCWKSFAFWHACSDHPWNGLAVIVKKKKRESYFINTAPVLGEIGSNQKVRTSVAVKVSLPNIGPTDTSLHFHYRTPGLSIIVLPVNAEAPILLGTNLDAAELDRCP